MKVVHAFLAALLLTIVITYMCYLYVIFKNRKKMNRKYQKGIRVYVVEIVSPFINYYATLGEYIPEQNSYYTTDDNGILRIASEESIVIPKQY